MSPGSDELATNARRKSIVDRWREAYGDQPLEALTLTFAAEAHLAAFCSWFDHCFGTFRLTCDMNTRTVHVTVSKRVVRTVLTVARYNGAIVHAA